MELSKLSQFLSISFSSTELMRKTAADVKTHIMKKMRKGNLLFMINTLVTTSISRTIGKLLSKEDRTDIYIELLNRVCNA